MKYQITLRDKSQIEISEKDYNNISNFLGKLKLFKLSDGQIVNASDIIHIAPIPNSESPSNIFRIEAPKTKGKKYLEEQLKKLWESMKAKGHFPSYGSYESYIAARQNNPNS